MPVITQVLAPAQTNGTGNPFSLPSFTPTVGDVVVCSFGMQASPPTPTDTCGDSGGQKTAWAPVSGLTNLAGGASFQYTMFWRVIGNSPGAMVISVANGGGVNCNGDVGQYRSSDSSSWTWGVDGTPVTAASTGANPSGGNITTTRNAFIYNRFSTVGGGNPTAGTGYTVNYAGAPGINREAQEWGEFDAVTNQPTAWVFASADYLIFAAAFAKFPPPGPTINTQPQSVTVGVGV